MRTTAVKLPLHGDRSRSVRAGVQSSAWRSISSCSVPIPTTSKSVSARRLPVTPRPAMRVGLCDLTRAELSTNGSPEQREEEADAAAAVLGAAWRENLGWPDGGITRTPELIRSAVDLIRRHRPRAIAVPYWDDRHPDHVAASDVLSVAVFRSALRRYESAAAAVATRLDLLLLHQRRRAAVVRRRRLATITSASARRWPATPASSRRTTTGAVATRLTAPTFRQLIESRDAQFGALAGVALRRRRRRAASRWCGRRS